MNKPHYRLLNSNEDIQSGDEYYDFVEHGWTPVPPFPPYGKAVPLALLRRLIEPPKWISVKERAPEFPSWLFNSGYKNKVWLLARDYAGTTAGTQDATHWMPAPPWPEPPKENEDEKAFLEWLKTPLPQNSVHLTKAAWFAALEYARKK